jgi:hypothetical protein
VLNKIDKEKIMIYKKTKKAYKEILDVVNNYRDIIVYDISDLEKKSETHLFGIKLKEKYGFDINPTDIYSLDWTRFGDYRSIGWFGKKYNRTISWSDNGKQPKDELLLEIGFSTGAYIFGDDYPTELFQQFWQELKNYSPKYIDTTNKNLYFSMENASKVFNDFKTILDKYYEINKKDSKERKIKKLKEELNKLSS